MWARAHQGGHKHTMPTINCANTAIKSAITLKFVKPDSQQMSLQAAEQEIRSPKMSTIRRVTAAEPAPTILIHISTNKRFYQAQVLPDSGADISAAA